MSPTVRNVALISKIGDRSKHLIRIVHKEREIRIEERGYLMKTTIKSKRRVPVLLSILCAGLVTAFLGGCAEGPYVTAYDGGYYPYSYYYGGYPYSYYGPAYETTVVRSGVSYNDAYGPRYYPTRTVYGDW
jgi:hypothetical protein